MSAPQLPSEIYQDRLGQVLHTLRLTGTLYCQTELSAPWGIEIPDLPGLVTLAIVTEGQCQLVIDDQIAMLRPGSIALLPHGAPHALRSDAKAALTNLYDLDVEMLSPRYERLVFGGGGEVCRLTYGVFRPDGPTAARLIAGLPPSIHVERWQRDDQPWIDSSLGLIAREARSLHPGGEAVLTRLADVLVIQTLRAWLDREGRQSQGWLAALTDPHLGRALSLIHEKPHHPWSVADLAREAGVSRSGFAARFTDVLGETPMLYLTRWRLDCARQWLGESRDSIGEIADRVGYKSEAAFARAFKRHFGMGPGAARRDARG